MKVECLALTVCPIERSVGEPYHLVVGKFNDSKGKLKEIAKLVTHPFKTRKNKAS
jgi:hypothetical protein